MPGFGLGSLGPAGYIGAGLDIAGAFGAFGKGGNSGYDAARAGADTEAKNIADYGNTWAGVGRQGLAQFNPDYAAQRNAINKQISYYSQDPNTDQRYASDLSRASGATDANVAAAQNAALARSTSMGQTSVGGGPSSGATGAEAYLAAQGMLAKNRAQTDVANLNLQRVQQYMGNVSDLTGGLATGDMGRAEYGFGQATQDANIDMNYYGNLANTDYAHQMQQTQGGLGSLASSLGGIGTIAGLGAAPSGAGASTPAASVANNLPVNNGPYTQSQPISYNNVPTIGTNYNGGTVPPNPFSGGLGRMNNSLTGSNAWAG